MFCMKESQISIRCSLSLAERQSAVDDEQHLSIFVRNCVVLTEQGMASVRDLKSRGKKGVVAQTSHATQNGAFLTQKGERRLVIL